MEDPSDGYHKRGADQPLFIVQPNALDKWVRRPEYELFQTTFSCDLVKDKVATTEDG